MKNEKVIVKKEVKNDTKLLSLNDLSKQLKLGKESVRRAIKKVLPDKLKNGYKTLLNEKEVSEVLNYIKSNQKVHEQVKKEAKENIKSIKTTLMVKKEANDKLVQGLETIKELNLKDQYKVVVNLQKNILNQMKKQFNKIYNFNLKQLNKVKKEEEKKVKVEKMPKFYIAKLDFKKK